MKEGGSYYSVNVLCIDIVQFKFKLQIQVGHLLFGQLLSSALDREKVEDFVFLGPQQPFWKIFNVAYFVT